MNLLFPKSTKEVFNMQRQLGNYWRSMERWVRKQNLVFVTAKCAYSFLKTIKDMQGL